MAIHNWSLLCRKSVVDKEDNTMSIFEILEGIKVDLPEGEDKNAKTLQDAAEGKKIAYLGGNTASAMSLVSYWWREDINKPESITSRLKVITPFGKAILQQEIPIDLTKSEKARTVLKFPAIPFQGTGVYKYIIQQKKGTKKKPRWITEVKILFDINLSKPILEEKKPRKKTRKKRKK